MLKELHTIARNLLGLHGYPMQAGCWQEHDADAGNHAALAQSGSRVGSSIETASGNPRRSAFVASARGHVFW